MMIRLLTVCLLCTIAFAAGAQNMGTPVAAETSDTPAKADQDPVSERNCLRHTGSRITATVNAKRGAGRGKRECAPAFGRSYSREDLDRTGRTNVAEALRMLDPSVH